MLLLLAALAGHGGIPIPACELMATGVAEDSYQLAVSSLGLDVDDKLNVLQVSSSLGGDIRVGDAILCLNEQVLFSTGRAQCGRTIAS